MNEFVGMSRKEHGTSQLPQSGAMLLIILPVYFNGIGARDVTSQLPNAGAIT